MRPNIKSNKTINIIECEGAICISVDSNYNKYYAKGIHKRRKLDILKINLN